MTKTDHIEFWKKSAASDWPAVEGLFEKKAFPQALFFAHLVLEKLLKAHWVQDNSSDFPPKTHNLVRLANQTSLAFSSDDLLFLDRMNDFQMEGRYPDYLFMIQKICTEAFTFAQIQEVEKIKKWLLNQLP